MKIEFLSSEFFYLLSLLLLLLIGKKSFINYKSHFSAEMFEKIFPNGVKKRYSFYLFIISFITIVIALARPVLYATIELEKKEKSFIVGLDLSKSMLAKDIYPSRLEFAKNKLFVLFETLEEEKVGILGFSSEPFLIAPMTHEYKALHSILTHLQLDTINTKGSDIFPLLQQANIFLKDKEQKVVLIFSDGTEEKNFEKSIQYAKENHIKVFVYGIGTPKGGVIEQKGELLQDTQENIVITTLNSAIQKLCEQTGGKYFEYSLQTADMKNVVDAINQILDKQQIEKEKSAKRKELFYLPLIISLLCFFIAVIGFQRGKRG